MVYAVYDTTGIQSYIFASTKLKENIGASELVGRVFKCFLPQVLKYEFGENNVLTDWETERAIENWALSKTAEIIYVGGGNAYVAYQSVDDYKKATGAFLRKVYSKTATIGIASAYVETDFNGDYACQHKRLMKKLSQVKDEINRPIAAGNQPITKTSLLSGLPVTCVLNGELLSEDQYLKREVNTSGLDEFDSLKRGRTSFLAVLHIDGNNMGKHIEKYMQSDNEWSTAVPKIREMSYRISKLYEQAYEAARQTFCEFYNRSEKYRSDDNQPPLIKLIGDGDDITCVITGLWGISFAAELLREIEAHSKQENLYPFKNWSTTEKPNVSACAGVVLFHSHYPFSEAYKMAEECCKNAKSYTRDAKKYTEGVVGSFIDFHIHHGGTITALKAFRREQYSVDDKPTIYRPYCVINRDVAEPNATEQLAQYPNFCDFDTLMYDWTQQSSENPWPRSRLKALRDAIASEEEEVKKVIDWCNARGFTLPENSDKPIDAPDLECENKPHKYAPLFDVLEFADVYENISKGVKKQCE